MRVLKLCLLLLLLGAAWRFYVAPSAAPQRSQLARFNQRISANASDLARWRPGQPFPVPAPSPRPINNGLRPIETPIAARPSKRPDNTPVVEAPARNGRNPASHNEKPRLASRNLDNWDGVASRSGGAGEPGGGDYPNDAYPLVTRGNLPLRLPGPATIGKTLSRVPRFSTAAAYRAYGDAAVRDRRYGEAAEAFRTEAALYRRTGLNDAAALEERKAERYATDVRLFAERAATPGEMKTLYTGARLEPFAGCYIGAFIDRDERLTRTFFGDNWQVHRYPEDFARLVGKPHASYFMYLAYGQPFPYTWVARLKAQGAIPHIALEPRNMQQVQNDAYLQSFARACGSLNWPVFIRFAGEMNGFWSPYHKNPALYRAKFRLLHQTLRRHAPRAATIWCVNSVPFDNIHLYYPGDDGCDWVGINLYAVPFYDNDPRRPAQADSPLALIEPIYSRYSRRKPIAIGEFAASHMAAADRVRRTSLAVDKMAQVYGALPRLFPRIKMINWFDMNNIVNARPGRQLNDYSLTSQPALLGAYRRAVSEPYFLTDVQRANNAPPPLPRPLMPDQKLSGVARLSVWAKTYVPRPKVYLHIAGKIVYASAQPGAHVIALDTRQLPTGRQTVTAFVFDQRNKFITSVSSAVTVVP